MAVCKLASDDTGKGNKLGGQPGSLAGLFHVSGHYAGVAERVWIASPGITRATCDQRRCLLSQNSKHTTFDRGQISGLYCGSRLQAAH